jgi:hypothetical protein
MRSCVDISNFDRHLFKIHTRHHGFKANKKLRETPKIYFNKLFLTCFVCKTVVEFQNFLNHLCSHSMIQIAHYEIKISKQNYCIKIHS